MLIFTIRRRYGILFLIGNRVRSVRTDAELRPSRPFNSIIGYVKKSIVTIIGAFIMYRPSKFFMGVGLIHFIAGIII